MAGGLAKLQQSGADSSEPLPARLGAFSAVAPRVPLRIRAGATGPLPRRDDAVLGLDNGPVQARDAGRWQNHPEFVQSGAAPTLFAIAGGVRLHGGGYLQ